MLHHNILINYSTKLQFEPDVELLKLNLFYGVAYWY